MVIDGDFCFFFNGERKTRQEIEKLIDYNTTVSIKGLNVCYFSPKKPKTKEMNRLIEEELERQEHQKSGILPNQYVLQNEELNSAFDYDFNDIKIPKEELGKKETKNKTDYSEIDWQFIEGLAKRMNKNKEKYEPFNYHKPMDIELLKQSLLRHTLEIMKGNYDDAGQDFGHFYATALNSMMIFWQIKNNKLGYIK